MLDGLLLDRLLLLAASGGADRQSCRRRGALKGEHAQATNRAMGGSLRQHATRLLRPLLDATASRPVVWRSMGFLFTVAGLIVLATVVSGLGEDAHVTAITGLGVTALAVGLTVGMFARHIPESAAATALVLGLVMVSLGVVASGQAESPYSLFYIWIGVEAWFFLSTRRAVALTALTVVLSYVVITRVEAGDPDARNWWIAIVGSLLAVSALAGVLYGRAQHLIGLLSEVAVSDELTGLLNRRGYQQRLREELARAERGGKPLSIVLGDIDGFKALNDRFGHSEGDEALQAFAETCRRHVRDVDFMSRVGGEEFAIVLPGADEAAAFLAAERLRRGIRSEMRTPDGAAITASFGIATYPEHGSKAECLLDHADQAMYAAKRLGRDCTVPYSSDMSTTTPSLVNREQLQAVVLLAETLDVRDAGTCAHSRTVSSLCESTARALQLPSARVERIRLAGLVHDIGKIGVPDHVLRKPGGLSHTEWIEMRKHPELGSRIVAAAGLDDIAGWVLAHHERVDGNGYPNGLPGDEIPLEARILSVADAYEAMTADRPYRKSMEMAEAIAELQRQAGTQFDATVVEAFLSTLGREVAQRVTRTDCSAAGLTAS